MKKLLVTTILLLVTILCGCSWLSPNRTAVPKAFTPSPPVRTQSISTVAPDKTASQDTAGAVTKLPEAATAASDTARP